MTARIFEPKMRGYISSNCAVAMVEYRNQLINERHHVSDASENLRARTTKRALIAAANGLEDILLAAE